MHLSLAFLFRQSKPKVLDRISADGGNGQQFIDTYRRRNTLSTFARIANYTPPQSDYNGRGHTSVLRSIGGPEPAIDLLRGPLPTDDPRGFAGNSPVPLGTRFSPLLSSNPGQYASGSPAVGG